MHSQTILRLFSPLKYLKIYHEAKYIYDFVLPILLAIISTVILFLIPNKPPFFGINGIVTYVSDILKYLSPFYIAALAATATFNSPSIDSEFEGNKPYLIIKVKGKKIRENLNRRQFLCLAFGYLALSNLIMYFVGYISWIVAINIHESWLNCGAIKFFFSFLYLSAFFNILTTTMLGLSYLSERLHWKRDN